MKKCAKVEFVLKHHFFFYTYQCYFLMKKIQERIQDVTSDIIITPIFQKRQELINSSTVLRKLPFITKVKLPSR